MNSEFPCRTKTISGTNYIVSIYTLENKKLVGSTCCFTEDQANNMVERYTQNSKYYCEIVPSHWAKDICIECGQEQY